MAESRGDRARLIRKAVDETQELFAARLTQAAQALGLPVSYDGQTVSKIENEYRDLQLEDLAVYEAVDPLERSWFWLAFGRDRPAVARRGAKVSAGGIAAKKSTDQERKRA